MAKTKYPLEYELTGNTLLWVEDTIYIDKTNKNVSIGKMETSSYKLLVTGDTYSEQYYMRTPDTGTANDYLIYESGKIKKRTGGGGSATPGGTNYNIQYYSGGTLTGTSSLDWECQRRLKITDILNVASRNAFPTTDGGCFTLSEGDIVRLSGSDKYSDGYYVYDGFNWIAIVTW